MLQCKKKHQNNCHFFCLKSTETSIILILFWLCPLRNSHLYCLLFLTVAEHILGTSKIVSWSVTIYDKNLSSQCKLAAQIEQVQEKMYYVTKDYDSSTIDVWDYYCFSISIWAWLTSEGFNISWECWWGWRQYTFLLIILWPIASKRLRAWIV